MTHKKSHSKSKKKSKSKSKKSKSNKHHGKHKHKKNRYNFSKKGDRKKKHHHGHGGGGGGGGGGSVAPEKQHQAFKLKGKMPPREKTSKVTPSMLTPDQMTTIYHVPNEHFKTDRDVCTYNCYDVLEQIGKGGFAVIFKAKNTKTGQMAACKLVEIGNDASRIEEMKNELYIMELVDSTFAVKLFLHFMVNTNLFIFMQLADAGSFGKLLEKEGPFNETDSAYFFAQMVCGTEYMHSLTIAHRDIKPANFLMTEQSGQKVVLISDYGLSRVIHSQSNGEPCLYHTQCGTPAFMAPEILAAEEYNAYLVDVWSLGVTLYAMLCNELPFDVEQEDYGVAKMKANEWQFNEEMRDTPSEALNQIMSGMLEADWHSRLSIKQLSTHEWLKAEYDKAKKLERKK